MAVIETWIKTDLKSIVKVTPIHGILFTQDNMANLIGVELLEGGQPATVTGSVSANVLRADGTTVAVSGTLSGNKASVTLPQAAYAVPGMLAVVIKLTDSSTVTTIGAIQAIVYRASTDTIIDPGTIIPSVQDLIAAIDAAVDSIPPDYSALTAEVGDLKNATTIFDTVENATFTASKYYGIGAIGSTVDAAPSSSTAGLSCVEFECVAGDVFQVTLAGGGSTSGGGRAYGFLDANRAVLARATQGQIIIDGILVAPTNSAYLVINSYDPAPNHPIDRKYAVKGNLISSKVNQLGTTKADKSVAIINNNNTIPEGTTSADQLTDNTIVFISTNGGVPRLTDVPYAPCWVETIKASNTISIQRCYPYNNFGTNKPKFRVKSSGTFGDWQDWGIVFTYTLETSNDTYNNTYNITTSPQITTDDNGWLNAVDTDTADETNKTDMTGAIMSMLNDTGYCHLGPGIFYVSGNIDMPRYATLEGCGESTIIRLLQSVQSGYTVRVCQNNLVSGIRFSGGRSDLDYTSDVIGGRYGIAYLGNADGNGSVSYPTATSCNIIDCSFENFSGAGIYCNNTGGSIYQALKVEQCYIKRCIVGININYYSEYHKFSEVVTYNCHWACINNGGNNVFVGCTFAGVNGFLIDNSQSDKRNNGHGSAIGCTFNHISEYAIQIINCDYGFVFDGCQNFYGKVQVVNSVGIVFSNLLTGGTTEYPPRIYQTGASLPLFFIGCIFITAPTFDGDNIKCVNCYRQDGTQVQTT